MLANKFSKGFTLIEVMAAVAIFAVSATGLYAINQQSVFLADRLEKKTFSHWVALNALAEVEMLRTLPVAIDSSETFEMADMEWKVVTKVFPTQVSTVKRINIQVSLEGSDSVLSSIDAYIGLRSAKTLNAY